MNVDICIPAYNEEEVIGEAVEKVKAALQTLLGIRWQIIVADNGSTDRTAERAKSSGATVRTISGRGKGLAISEAARFSKADIFGFIDADLSASPEDIVPLIKIVQSDMADIAVGSRLLDTHSVRRGFLRTYSSRAFNRLRKLLLNVDVKDTQCGLKIMNAQGREILGNCTEKGWFFDMEFLARAEKLGLIIREVPIHWDEYRFPNRQSKLRLYRDAFGGVLAMIRIRRSVKKQ